MNDCFFRRLLLCVVLLAATEACRAQAPAGDELPIPEAAKSLVRIYEGADPPRYIGSGLVFHTAGDQSYVCLPSESARPNTIYVAVTNAAGPAKRIPLSPIRSSAAEGFGQRGGAGIFSAARELLPEPLKWEAGTVPTADGRTVIIVADVLPTDQAPSLTFPRAALRGKLVKANATATEPDLARATRKAPFGAVENADRRFTFKEGLVCDEQGKPLAMLGWVDETYDLQRAVTQLEILDALALGDLVGSRAAPAAADPAKLQIDVALMPLGKAPDSLKITAVPLPKTEDLESVVYKNLGYAAGTPPTGTVELAELKQGTFDPTIVRRRRGGDEPSPTTTITYTALIDMPPAYADGGALWLFGTWRDEFGRERRTAMLMPAMSQAYSDLQKQLRDERNKAAQAARAAKAEPAATATSPSEEARKITPIPAAEIK